MLGKSALLGSSCVIALSANLVIGALVASAQVSGQGGGGATTQGSTEQGAARQQLAAAETTTGTVPEVMVTARRIEESLQKVPIAISVVNQTQLHDEDVHTFLEMEKLSPGLQISNSDGSPFTQRFVIRGQGQSFSGGPTSSPAYFAEVPNFQISFYDLDNVQVLKGPQGTLFGGTATGGAILFEPKRPTDTWDGYAIGQLGNLNYKSFEGAIGGPIVGDKLMFRVAGSYRVRDGYTTANPSYNGPAGNANTIPFDNLDQTDWRVSLVWKPTSNFENYTVYSGEIRRSNGSGQVLYYANPQFMSPAVRNVIPANNPATATLFQALTGQAPPAGETWGQLIVGAQAQQVAAGFNTVFNNYDRHNEQDFNGLVNQTRWDVLPGLSIKNILGLYYFAQKGAVLDTDASNLPVLDTYDAKTAQGGAAWTGGWPNRDWTEEIQVIGDSFRDRLKWQVGFFYEDLRARNFTGGGAVVVTGVYQGFIGTQPTCAAFGEPQLAECEFVSRSDSWDDGLYGQGTLAILDNLHFTAGLRYSTDAHESQTSAGPFTFNLVNGVQVPTNQLVGQIPGATAVNSIFPPEHALTYTLALDWQVDERNLLYVTTRSGYKPGGVNGGVVPAADLFFKPESDKDVELGWKSDFDLFGIRGRTDVDYYKDWYSNIQQRQLIPGTSTEPTLNLANGIIQGVEAEGTFIPSKWFEVSGYFAWTDAFYTNYVQNALCSGDFYLPACNGLPGSTVVTINHSAGLLTVNGVNASFTPDPFNSVSEWRWGLKPVVHLDSLVSGQNLSVSANVYYKSHFTTDSNAYSELVGTNLAEKTVFGTTITNPLIMPAQLMADLRVDWLHINGSRYDAAFYVTNVTNLRAPNGTAGGLTIAGVVPTLVTEPRFWAFEVSTHF